MEVTSGEELPATSSTKEEDTALKKEREMEKLITIYQTLCDASEMLSRDSKKKRKAIKLLKKKMARLQAENNLMDEVLKDFPSTEQ